MKILPHGQKSYLLTRAGRSANHGQVGWPWLAGNSYFPCGRIFISYSFSEPLVMNIEGLNSLWLGDPTFYFDLIWRAMVSILLNYFDSVSSSLHDILYWGIRFKVTTKIKIMLPLKCILGIGFESRHFITIWGQIISHGNVREWFASRYDIGNWWATPNIQQFAILWTHYNTTFINAKKINRKLMDISEMEV